MLCPHCGAENPDDALVCSACREVIDDDLADAFDDASDAHQQTDARPNPLKVAPVPSDDDWAVAGHTMGQELGGVRAPTPAEAERPDVMLRADAVLEMKPDTDITQMSPFEQHIAAHLDGIRTVARVRKKTGLSGDDVRIALGLLRDRGVLVLAGLLDPNLPAAPRELVAAPVAEAEEWEDPSVATMPGMDTRHMESVHGPTADAMTDPNVPRELLDELRKGGDDNDG